MADGVTIPATGTGDATPKVATKDAGTAGQVQVVQIGAAGVNAAVLAPIDAALGLSTNPAKLDAVNDEVATGGSASTTGALTPYKLISAASTNPSSVKASAGRLYHIMVMNANASARFLKFYDKASAPVVGTDVPVLCVPLAPSFAAANYPMAPGVKFTNGIALALTTGAADTDTGAVAVGEIIISLLYK